MGDCNIFREELAIRYPNHGHALWDPDPGGLYDSVAVGDVGFIRDGYFYRLFNALLLRDPPSDPSDPNTHDDHGLVYPPRLQPKTSQHIRKSRDSYKDFRSKNIVKESYGPNIYAAGPDDDLQVTVSCSGKKGALLSLPFPAEREDTVARDDFGKWLVKNIDSCMRIAEELGLGINRMEDIILVTGRHLARSWINTVFSECRGRAQVSFIAQVTGDSSLHLEERNASGGDLKLGPSGENLPENQCIFVRGFRVVRILNIWPRLRGLAGPASDMADPDSDPGSDTRLQLISIPAESNDPLHVLLEYISEQAPDCDVALVHDDDLEFLVSSQLETLEPDALLGHLRNLAPAIQQVQCELLSGDGDESGAEAETATVATLSNVVFKAPRANQAACLSTDGELLPGDGGGSGAEAKNATVATQSNVVSKARRANTARISTDKLTELTEQIAVLNDRIPHSISGSKTANVAVHVSIHDQSPEGTELGSTSLIEGPTLPLLALRRAVASALKQEDIQRVYTAGTFYKLIDGRWSEIVASHSTVGEIAGDQLEMTLRLVIS